MPKIFVVHCWDTPKAVCSTKEKAALWIYEYNKDRATGSLQIEELELDFPFMKHSLNTKEVK